VQNRNSDAQRHPKPQLNLVFRKKVARIQAAGVAGFVKRCSKLSDRAGETCDEAEAPITVCATQTGELNDG
jgi:hypothetical protein